MIFSLKKYKDNLLLHRYVNLLSVDILIKASGFILLPVYLKLLTQREFGLYNYLISIVAFFSQVLNFGLFVSQSKIYPQLETNEKGVFIYNIQILLFLLLSPTLFIIYIFHIDNFVISLLFKSPIDYSKYRFSLLLAIISSIYSFMLYNYLLTAERIKYVQRYNLIRLVLLNSIVLMVLYFYKDDRVNARILTTYIIEIALVAIFSYHYVKEMSPVVRKDQIVRSMKIGFPIMFSAICGVVINFGDKFLLEKHSGFIDLSVYYLAFSIANVIPLVFTTFQNIWLPIFHKERDLTKNLAMTKKTFFRLLFAFTIISLLLIVGMKIALYFSLIDMKYNPTLIILPIILFSVTLDSLTHLYMNYITFFEKTYIMPLFSISMGCLSILSNIYFINNYGLYGAAFSSLIINILDLILYYTFLRYNISRINRLKININE